MSNKIKIKVVHFSQIGLLRYDIIVNQYIYLVNTIKDILKDEVEFENIKFIDNDE